MNVLKKIMPGCKALHMSFKFDNIIIIDYISYNQIANIFLLKEIVKLRLREKKKTYRKCMKKKLSSQSYLQIFIAEKNIFEVKLLAFAYFSHMRVIYRL